MTWKRERKEVSYTYHNDKKQTNKQGMAIACTISNLIISLIWLLRDKYCCHVNSLTDIQICKQGPNVALKKHRILAEDLITSNFLNVNENKQRWTNSGRNKHKLFCPIFWKTLPFFIRMLQTVVFKNWYITDLNRKSLENDMVQMLWETNGFSLVRWNLKVIQKRLKHFFWSQLSTYRPSAVTPQVSPKQH